MSYLAHLRIFSTYFLLLFLQTEYKVKWLNYPSSANSWENEGGIDCDVLLPQFEIKWAKRIVAVKFVGEKAMYTVEFKSRDTREVARDEALQKWPKLVAAFLEKAIIWRHNQIATCIAINTVALGSSAIAPVKVTCK